VDLITAAEETLERRGEAGETPGRRKGDAAKDTEHASLPVDGSEISPTPHQIVIWPSIGTPRRCHLQTPRPRPTIWPDMVLHVTRTRARKHTHTHTHTTHTYTHTHVQLETALLTHGCSTSSERCPKKSPGRSVQRSWPCRSTLTTPCVMTIRRFAWAPWPANKVIGFVKGSSVKGSSLVITRVWRTDCDDNTHNSATIPRDEHHATPKHAPVLIGSHLVKASGCMREYNSTRNSSLKKLLIPRKKGTLYTVTGRQNARKKCARASD
jgi:hypothetical protein